MTVYPHQKGRLRLALTADGARTLAARFLGEPYGAALARQPFHARLVLKAKRRKGAPGFHQGTDRLGRRAWKADPKTAVHASQSATQRSGVAAGADTAPWRPEWQTPTPEAFIAARDQSKRPAYLSDHTADDLREHRLFLSRDGKVGFAIDPHGDVQNVFNNGGPRGAGVEAVFHAIDMGGRTLDCFDGFLPDRYAQFGFVETGRIRFNQEMRPRGWDLARQGTPDVVFMAFTGERHERAIIRDVVASRRPPVVVNDRSTRYFEDFDEAKAHSRSVVGAGVHGGIPRLGVDAGERGTLHRPSGDDRRHLNGGSNVKKAVSHRRIVLQLRRPAAQKDSRRAADHPNRGKKLRATPDDSGGESQHRPGGLDRGTVVEPKRGDVEKSARHRLILRIPGDFVVKTTPKAGKGNGARRGVRAG